jgi:hypothetical protein
MVILPAARAGDATNATLAKASDVTAADIPLLIILIFCFLFRWCERWIGQAL